MQQAFPDSIPDGASHDPDRRVSREAPAHSGCAAVLRLYRNHLRAQPAKASGPLALIGPDVENRVSGGKVGSEKPRQPAFAVVPLEPSVSSVPGFGCPAHGSTKGARKIANSVPHFSHLPRGAPPA